MNIFQRYFIIPVGLFFLSGCASDGSFQIPDFGFEDPSGEKVQCHAVSKTMQACQYIKPNGKKYWINLPIIKWPHQEPEEETPEAGEKTT